MVSVAEARTPLAAASARVQVAIVADLLEERWPSMDLVADMLLAHVAQSGTSIAPSLMRPSFARTLPFSRRPTGAPQPTSQRIFHRFWSYPRWLRAQPPADVYHVVDHSYAHLAHDLPPGRVVISCHDIDAFRALLGSGEGESYLPRLFVRRLLTGLRRAAVITCGSERTRADLVANDLAEIDRIVVVPYGVHPACTAVPDPAADADAMELTGPVGGADLLHVGSTIPRKRIDVLLEVLAAVSRERPGTRLWRVGGAFTAAQAARAQELGIAHLVTVLPFVSRPVLAALYRRASLVVMPSEREGFGLPVIEAMACGTPVVCSDLPVLREVGGEAAAFCAMGDVEAWSARILALLGERDRDARAWSARREAALSQACRFTWTGHAAAMREIYLRVACGRS